MKEYTSQILYLSPFLLLAYAVVLVIYRLYFHPLAKFPGPKLNAATQLVEFYFDVIKDGGGKYIWEIEKLHKKYGPVVRISPYEIHTIDPDHWSEVYVGQTVRKSNKWAFAIGGVSFPGSIVLTAGHEQHRIRRKAGNPFFSKIHEASANRIRINITKLESVIWEQIERLRVRLEEFRDAGRPINIGDAASAMGIDIMTSYAFAFSYNNLEHPDFNGHLFLESLPNWLAIRLNPALKEWLAQVEQSRKHIQSIADSQEDVKASGFHRTIVHDILADKSLPPAEKDVGRLVDEVQGFIGGSGETTARTMSVLIFYVLKNKQVEDKLRESLKEVMSGYPNDMPKLAELEKIEYLKAVLQETLRLGSPAAHRSQRISPDVPYQLGEWEIPPGYPVSMTQKFIHENPETYPEPLAFKPERWIDTKGLPVHKYFVPFGKGSRNCIGMNLAWAELYMTVAMLFRPGAPKLELFETTEADIEFVHDYFAVGLAKGRKGVQILVK